jgi:hypothetical protein
VDAPDVELDVEPDVVPDVELDVTESSLAVVAPVEVPRLVVAEASPSELLSSFVPQPVASTAPARL